MDHFYQFLDEVRYQAHNLHESTLIIVLALTLQTIGFIWTLVSSFCGNYVITTFFAITPIFTGAHASLTRPTSAAKPPKRRKTSDAEDAEDDDQDTVAKMESLGPGDAILLPLFAGATLTGLYLLIKWLEDPAILSKILNWYFAIFGAVATFKILDDLMDVVFDFVFPSAYCWKGRTWIVQPVTRTYQSTSDGLTTSSPLPARLSALPMPHITENFMWATRDLFGSLMLVRFYLHKIIIVRLKLQPLGILSVVIAVSCTLFSNLVSTPWYLNNLFGLAFVHSSLQMLSPTTSSTATLMLTALFAYDIYFVFYTPIMVTVATSLDIPAKLLIPRPGGMSMLGLGDLVIPGMVIGWALRFDLWQFYVKKQGPSTKSSPLDSPHTHFTRSRRSDIMTPKPTATSSTSIKQPYLDATGSWGTRYWIRSSGSQTSPGVLGTSFPKPYFFATLTGYILGIFTTIFIMQTYGHAQPALLYLVPGVLGALWTTACWRGEVRVMFNYVEGEDDDEKSKKENEQIAKKRQEGQGLLRSLFAELWTGKGKKDRKQGEKMTRQDDVKNGEDEEEEKQDGPSERGNEGDKRKEKVGVPEWAEDQLLHFSITTTRLVEPTFVEEDGRLVSKPSAENDDS